MTTKLLMNVTALLPLRTICAGFLLAWSAATAQTGEFAYRCGSEFCLGDSTFYFAGANVYDFFTFGDGGEYTDTALIENQFMDKARIDAHMARLARDQVTVVRLWAFSHETWHGFEPEKGVYSESQFMLFDYIIESAKRHGILLMPTLENYWEAYGGIDSRLEWEGVQGGHPGRWRFFNREICPGCFDSYKAYVDTFVTRVNHYSGVAYKDEPAIFAWDLMNEPRYQDATPDENATGTTLRAWVDEMAAHIKQLDPNHMVGVGIEAHEARYGFGGDEGNPFLEIQASPFIDFTSGHPYPTEPWADLTIDETRALIRTWIRESREILGKPFFMGEFNSHATPHAGENKPRADWWRGLYAEMEESGGNGSAFWWYSDRTYDNQFGVWEGQAELEVFREHSLRMQAKRTVPTTFVLRPATSSGDARARGILYPVPGGTFKVLFAHPSRPDLLMGPRGRRYSLPERKR